MIYTNDEVEYVRRAISLLHRTSGPDSNGRDTWTSKEIAKTALNALSAYREHIEIYHYYYGVIDTEDVQKYTILSGPYSSAEDAWESNYYTTACNYERVVIKFRGTTAIGETTLPFDDDMRMIHEAPHIDDALFNAVSNQDAQPLVKKSDKMIAQELWEREQQYKLDHYGDEPKAWDGLNKPYKQAMIAHAREIIDLVIGDPQEVIIEGIRHEDV